VSYELLESIVHSEFILSFQRMKYDLLCYAISDFNLEYHNKLQLL
jgi:hypothetical protein